MAELLKNIYNQKFFKSFTAAAEKVLPHFNSRQFLKKAMDAEWEEKELKQRMRHIATVLRSFMPSDYDQSLVLIKKLIEEIRKQDGREQGFEYMFFPDYIEQFGQDHLQSSLDAMEYVTQFTSCEFAVRPFIQKYPDQVLKQMLKWSKHKNASVRRFASEGCRPRLPWGMALAALKKDPSPIIPILENLKDDESEYVRRSVANNLNDIAKDNPQVVIKLINSWKGHSENTDWIIKHGCRTLLKKADADVYKLFGLNAESSCKVTDLKLDRKKLKIGEKLQFSFKLKPNKAKACKLRLEYAVYYLKANGVHNRKLFQIKEGTFNSDETYSFTRSRSFEDFTTRKHYPGKHKIAIVVNGKEMMSEEFNLY